MGYDSTYLIDYGKIPPQAVDIEEAVLGVCLNDKEALLDAMDKIHDPVIFYKETHQIIFQAMLKLYRSGNPVDILSVKELLQKTTKLKEIGGPLYLTELSGKAAGGFQTEYHCKILVQKWISREVIRISHESSRSAFDEDKDVQDVISEMISGITNALNVISSASTKHISEISNSNAEMIGKIMKGEYTLQGISTGIKEIDDFCNGLQKSDFVIIAARTSIGKTALAVTLAYNIAVLNNYTVLFFSLEMSVNQMDLRLKILATEIESTKIYKGNLSGTEYQDICEKSETISKSKLYIDDTAGITLMDMRTKIKRLTLKEKIDVIFVDYLQLMRLDDTKGKTRENIVSEISQGLKNIAKEFNIPIVGLSQLSRATELSSDQRPRLSHLRESGSQEQDADQVWFIYRPWKVGIKDIEGVSTYDKAEIIVAKHRNGPTGSANIGFHEKIMKFMSLDQLKDTQLEISDADLYDETDKNPF